jgi:diguanylate cyclase (GGDEF)-like protein
VIMNCSKGYLRIVFHVVPFVVAVLVQFVDSLTIRLLILFVLLAISLISTAREIMIASQLKSEHADLKRQAAAAEKMAITDGLTGLYNYRYLRSYLDDDFLSALGDDFVLSIIMADVDCFKAYNDKYGHLEGDQLLRWLAAIFKEAIRENDIVARYGGEEFVIVLPGIDSDSAVQIAERIRTKIESTGTMAEECALKGQVTVSFGIATYPTHALTSDELLTKADQALYRAKQLSKNTVCVSDES